MWGQFCFLKLYLYHSFSFSLTHRAPILLPFFSLSLKTTYTSLISLSFLCSDLCPFYTCRQMNVCSVCLRLSIYRKTDRVISTSRKHRKQPNPLNSCKKRDSRLGVYTWTLADPYIIFTELYNMSEMLSAGHFCKIRCDQDSGLWL